MRVKTEDHGAIRVLTLNEPDRRNPLSRAMGAALIEALDEAEHAPGVRVIVLTGAPPAFSAGADLAQLRQITAAPAEANLAHSEELMRLFWTMYTLKKPIVAAVNGHAIAGGAGLVLASDLAVMAEGAKLGFTEARLGFVAALVAVLLVRHVGEKAARDLLLSARLVSAREAKALGLVNEVAAPEDVLPRAIELAEALATNAPTSLALTKALLAELPGMGLFEGFRHATLANAWIRKTRDLEEGLAAFFEKRPPRFGS